MSLFFFCNGTATTVIYTYRHTLSLHDALPISLGRELRHRRAACRQAVVARGEEPEGTVRILVELGVHRDMMFALARRADHHIGAVGQGFPELLLDIVAHRKAPSCPPMIDQRGRRRVVARFSAGAARSEEHTSELQSLMRISYAVFCLTKKQQNR